jgi:hypothetical protein
MIGPVDLHRDMDFWQQDKWSGSFLVKWHIIKDIPNSSFRHIILENNENKPVTNSRDTQEVCVGFFFVMAGVLTQCIKRLFMSKLIQKLLLIY